MNVMTNTTGAMMTRSSIFGVFAVVLAAMGCSGNGGGGGGAAGSGGADGSGTDTTTASCTVAASGLCTQILVPSSSVSEENTQCTTIQKGTTGTGCSTTGLLGCCKEPSGASQETQCYYLAQNLSIDKSLCSTMKGTWSATP
jgi:hypothetical protein